MKNLFHKEILTSPKTTWAVGQLSKSTTRDITSHINRQNTKTVIEFWPGWGNITQTILDQLSPDGQLICFEINKKDFESHLQKITDPRLTIHYLSCEQIDRYIEQTSVDTIISTIPLSFIEKTTVASIIQKSYQALKPWGTFITGQYSSYAKQFLNPHFISITQRRHLRNLPPVCIITATK